MKRSQPPPISTSLALAALTAGGLLHAGCGGPQEPAAVLPPIPDPVTTVEPAPAPPVASVVARSASLVTVASSGPVAVGYAPPTSLPPALVPLQIATPPCRRAALALLMDRSGSMSGVPMEAAKRGLAAAVAALSADDCVEVLQFDSAPARVIDLRAVTDKRAVLAAIATIQPGGGTEYLGALQTAVNDLALANTRNKHIILLTDGQAPSQGLDDLTRRLAPAHISLSTIGLGSQVDPSLLQSLATSGGGRFIAVADPSNLPTVLEKEVAAVLR